MKLPSSFVRLGPLRYSPASLKRPHFHLPRASSSIPALEMTTIFRSPHPDISIPEDAAIWNKLEQHASQKRDKVALICGMTERTLSFGQVLEQAQQICAGLAASGIKKGDVVILHSFNCLEYPIVFFALNRLGAICSPSSPQFNAEELADQVRTAQAVAVISHVAFAKVASQAAALGGVSPEQVYTLGHPDGASSLQTIEDLIAKDLPFPNLPRIDPHDVVVLPFSSGTTGRPKGVELTARAMYACGARVSFLEVEADHILAVLPFFHIMATMIFHVTLFKGTSLIVLPKFEPHSFLRVVEHYKLKNVNIAPPLIMFFAKHPAVDKYDVSALTRLVSGGAPLGEELKMAVAKRLGVPVMQSYGLTELAGAATNSHPTAFRDGASGQLLPNTELKVRCLLTGGDLPANRRGELLIRCPAMMKGYFNNPEASRDAFTNDGFLRTGDVGYIDGDGFVFIIDRLKELIKYKGHQVAPAELEDVLNSHPLVADSCCVRGFDWVSCEEIPKAFVVLKDGDKTLAAGDLMAFVASRVAGYKRVREVEFIDAVPKSLSGKILRRELQLVQHKKLEAMRALRSHL